MLGGWTIPHRTPQRSRSTHEADGRSSGSTALTTAIDALRGVGCDLELIFISNTTSSNTASKYPTAFVRPFWRSCCSASASHLRHTSLCALKKQMLLSLRTALSSDTRKGRDPKPPTLSASRPTAHRRPVPMFREGGERCQLSDSDSAISCPERPGSILHFSRRAMAFS